MSVEAAGRTSIVGPAPAGGAAVRTRFQLGAHGGAIAVTGAAAAAAGDLGTIVTAEVETTVTAEVGTIVTTEVETSVTAEVETSVTAEIDTTGDAPSLGDHR